MGDWCEVRFADGESISVEQSAESFRELVAKALEMDTTLSLLAGAFDKPNFHIVPHSICWVREIPAPENPTRSGSNPRGTKT